MRNDKYNVGDLVFYYPVEDIESIEWEKKIALIIKAKNLLKLYDIIIQTENVIVKDVSFYSLEKVIS